MGALAFTASKPRPARGFFPLMRGVTHVPFPTPIARCSDPSRGDYGDAVVDYIENVIFARRAAARGRGRHPGRADPGRGRLRRPAARLLPRACARCATSTASC